MLLYEKKQAKEKKALLIGNNFMLERRTKLSFVSKSQFNQDGNVTTPVQFGGGAEGKAGNQMQFQGVDHEMCARSNCNSTTKTKSN